MQNLRRLICAAVLAVALPAVAAAEPATLRSLVEGAAARAAVAPDLVSAIIWVESRGHPWALNIRGRAVWPRSLADAGGILSRLTHDDVDIGLMQVNWRTWGPALVRSGIRQADLLDPWTNLMVGSRILRWAQEEEAGWGGVGRYHSATPWRKQQYAVTVARTWQALRPAFQASSPVVRSTGVCSIGASGAMAL